MDRNHHDKGIFIITDSKNIIFIRYFLQKFVKIKNFAMIFLIVLFFYSSISNTSTSTCGPVEIIPYQYFLFNVFNYIRCNFYSDSFIISSSLVPNSIFFNIPLLQLVSYPWFFCMLSMFPLYLVFLCSFLLQMIFISSIFS